MPDYLVHIIGLVSLAAAVFATWGLIRNRPQRTADVPLHAVSEWKPTGRIDFSSPRHEIEVPHKLPLSQGSFVLRVEEYRLVESDATDDAQRIEFRWRNATVDEARRVAAQHNASAAPLPVRLPLAAAAPPMAPDFDVPSVSTQARDKSRFPGGWAWHPRSSAPAQSGPRP